MVVYISTITSTNPTIPLRFKPNNTIEHIIVVTDNNSRKSSPGILQFLDSGIVVLFSNTANGNFTDSTYCGNSAYTSVSYIIASL